MLCPARMVILAKKQSPKRLSAEGGLATARPHVLSNRLGRSRSTPLIFEARDRCLFARTSWACSDHDPLTTSKMSRTRHFTRKLLKELGTSRAHHRCAFLRVAE